MTAEAIQSTDSPRGRVYWEKVDEELKGKGVTRAQVQSVWIKQADADKARKDMMSREECIEYGRLFETLDVLVLTLGQTEGWRWRADGAALSPLYPPLPWLSAGGGGLHDCCGGDDGAAADDLSVVVAATLIACPSWL